MDSEMLLGSLRDASLCVQSPFKVRFSQEGQHYVVEAVELSEFGFGENQAEALLDLQLSITGLYWALKSQQSRLGPDLAKLWAILQGKIKMEDQVEFRSYGDSR